MKNVNLEIDYKAACIIKHALRIMIRDKKEIIVKENEAGNVPGAKRAAGDLAADRCVYKGINLAIDYLLENEKHSAREAEVKEFAINLGSRLEELAKLQECR
ncbi:hypothetical protein [Clostridium sp. HBUAS56017]|uniref:hypothetical protein n=1 Tax=Clostridium sp. HBUAS56017 TaxID=2571128 RepID=UPI0011789392|nr:hypothetical protein [Clostridium sp. HBUAS56017]